MKTYRYTLEPYKGPRSRYTCPQCRNRQRTFVRYIDTHTGLHIADDVGRCGRQDNCTYHYTPKQFFMKNGHVQTSLLPARKRVVPRRELPQEISFIPDEHWQRSLRCYGDNHFVQYLSRLFGSKLAMELATRYHVGTSRHWKGASIFWQLNAQGLCRTGKIMLYDPQTGKRVKDPFNHICWVHSLKDKMKQPLYPDFALKQCLFGEHLLTSDVKDVALVESEKTAVIASHFYWDKVWLATGGKEALTADRCRILKGKNVFLYPDVGGYDKWDAAAKTLFPYYEITELTDEADGRDIADVLCKIK